MDVSKNFFHEIVASSAEKVKKSKKHGLKKILSSEARSNAKVRSEKFGLFYVQILTSFKFLDFNCIAVKS